MAFAITPVCGFRMSAHSQRSALLMKRQKNESNGFISNDLFSN